MPERLSPERPGRIDAVSGQIFLDLRSLSADAFGEMLRCHIFGPGRGYRDFDAPEPFETIPQEELDRSVVDEILGDPECRDEHHVVTAWAHGPVLAAYACDHDATMLLQVRFADGVRTVVNHDAKHDYGWSDVDL